MAWLSLHREYVQVRERDESLAEASARRVLYLDMISIHLNMLKLISQPSFQRSQKSGSSF